jgi:hypothetical protein
MCDVILLNRCPPRGGNNALRRQPDGMLCAPHTSNMSREVQRNVCEIYDTLEHAVISGISGAFGVNQRIKTSLYNVPSESFIIIVCTTSPLPSFGFTVKTPSYRLLPIPRILTTALNSSSARASRLVPSKLSTEE